VTGLSVYARPLTCASETIRSIDVSSFSGHDEYESEDDDGNSIIVPRRDPSNLILVIGAAQSYTLSSTTATYGLTCTIEYRLKVTGPNPSLITLSGNTITFAASDVLSDAG
jgi:hypothetical protein